MAAEVVRPPAVAGSFYPGDRRELDAALRGYLQEAAGDELAAPPKAVIAPHAGYVYSGPIAASAYVRVAKASGAIRRVVLLGPAHRVAVSGLAAPRAEAFATPLGEVQLDPVALERVLALPQVEVSNAAHALEHSLEVQLPFLQKILDRFDLVPLVVGDATPEQVAEVLDLLWGGEETLIVVSSDLSHFEDYATARRMDDDTSRAIEALEPEGIAYEHACGRIPVQGLLVAARRRGLRAQAIDVRNSGDTAGSRDSVVGYGAYVFSEPARAGADCDALLVVARESVASGLRTGQPLEVDPADYPPELRVPRATFVTLRLAGELRGCTGTLEAVNPLVVDVAKNAHRSAFGDPRFSPLDASEFPGLEYHISILGPLEPLPAESEDSLLEQLRPGIDGLVLREGAMSSTFLPAVWRSLPTPREFVRELKRKAGLAPDHWSRTLSFERYRVEEIP
jgi:AmmeMemoRadiSam system protein B/AmmeMemoRadiSam system protein A